MNACTHPDGHCWHETGTIILTRPLHIQEVCCRCGYVQGIYRNYEMTGEHGPYLPKPPRLPTKSEVVTLPGEIVDVEVQP